MANDIGDEKDFTQICNKEKMKINHWNLLKLKDYYFAGTSNDVDVYFEWEHKMNAFFTLCDCPEFEKVFTAAVQLTEDAQCWWTNEMINRKRYPTWDAMQNLMRKQYIPRDQYQDIRKQFRTLRQGDKTIMEYQRQFNHLRIRLNPGVSNENIMNHFVDGLSDDIRFQLQECKYNDLEDLFQKTTQIEVNIQMESMVTENILMSENCHEIGQVLRTKPFEEGENDEDLICKPMEAQTQWEMICCDSNKPKGDQKNKESSKYLVNLEVSKGFITHPKIQNISRYKGDQTFHIWPLSQLSFDLLQLGALKTQIFTLKKRYSDILVWSRFAFILHDQI